MTDPVLLLLASILLVLALAAWLTHDCLRAWIWGVVLRSRQLQEGDRVQVGRLPPATIVHLDWRSTTLRADDGSEFLIPGSWLGRRCVRHCPARDDDWRHITFRCSADVPPGRVQAALLEVLNDCDDIAPQPPPRVLNRGVAAGMINYRIEYRNSGFESGVVVDSTLRDRIWYALRRRRIPLGISSGPAPSGAQRAADARRQRELLGGVDLFADLQPELLEQVAAAARTLDYAAGESVVRQGDAGAALYLVECGEVQIQASGPAASEVEVRRLGPGQFFGELSLLTGERRSATVRAVGECRLVALDADDLGPILREAPALVAALRRVLEARQRDLRQRLHSVAIASSRDGEDLVERFMKNFALTW